MSCVVIILMTGNSLLCECEFAVEVPERALVVAQVVVGVAVEAEVEGELIGC